VHRTLAKRHRNYSLKLSEILNFKFFNTLKFEWHIVNNFFHFSEPFEKTNTARSVNNHNVFSQIKEAITNSYNQLKETMSLDSIFC